MSCSVMSVTCSRYAKLSFYFYHFPPHSLLSHSFLKNHFFPFSPLLWGRWPQNDQKVLFCHVVTQQQQYQFPSTDNTKSNVWFLPLRISPQSDCWHPFNDMFIPLRSVSLPRWNIQFTRKYSSHALTRYLSSGAPYDYASQSACLTKLDSVTKRWLRNGY